MTQAIILLYNIIIIIYIILLLFYNERRCFERSNRQFEKSSFAKKASIKTIFYSALHVSVIINVYVSDTNEYKK